jgi:hypothetical protein
MFFAVEELAAVRYREYGDGPIQHTDPQLSSIRRDIDGGGFTVEVQSEEFLWIHRNG